MFFGLEVKSNQNQAKPITLTNNLRLGQAVLDPSKAGKKEPVSLVAEYNKKQFIICVLDPNQSWQAPLDLCFDAGSQVKFFIRGSGSVHLTGYDVPDDMDDLYISSDDDLAISNSDDQDEFEPARKKKMVGESPKAMKANGVKGSSKKNGLPVKRAADHEGGEDKDDDDEDSSDDDSMDDEDIDIDDEDTSDDESDILDDDEDEDEDEDDEEEEDYE